VTKKRKVLDVVMQVAQLEEGLARMLERLGLERRTKEVDIAAALASLHDHAGVTPPARAGRPPAAPDTPVAPSAPAEGVPVREDDAAAPVAPSGESGTPGHREEAAPPADPRVAEPEKQEP